MEKRVAIYAGSFYPKEKKELSKMVSSFIKKATKIKVDGKIKALIVPHAGYVYSGCVAAQAFSLINSEEEIILFGPSHSAYLEGAFTFSGKWISPLGEVEVAPADLPIVFGDKEHCLEVELPFLQTVLKKFKLKPIIYGEISSMELADIINFELTKKSFLVASSDLSHYLSYELAKKIDKETIDYILNLDLNGFEKNAEACGKTGILALMIIAKKNNWKPKLLMYKNSGDTSKNKDSVVGYCAIAFVEEKKVGE